MMRCLESQRALLVEASPLDVAASAADRSAAWGEKMMQRIEQDKNPSMQILSEYRKSAATYRMTAKSNRSRAKEYYQAAERWLELAARNNDLARKYERAARYPWLPVEPDPPEPE
jgi:hypothetical protein